MILFQHLIRMNTCRTKEMARIEIQHYRWRYGQDRISTKSLFRELHMVMESQIHIVLLGKRSDTFCCLDVYLIGHRLSAHQFSDLERIIQFRIRRHTGRLHLNDMYANTGIVQQFMGSFHLRQVKRQTPSFHILVVFLNLRLLLGGQLRRPHPTRRGFLSRFRFRSSSPGRGEDFHHRILGRSKISLKITSHQLYRTDIRLLAILDNILQSSRH